MLYRLRRGIWKTLGYQFIEILEDSPSRLTLSFGPTKTVFDRISTKICQNGKLVAMAELVEKVELHQPRNQEGPPNWLITVHIKGLRQIEIGSITDSTDASIIGARISTAVDRPVIVGK